MIRAYCITLLLLLSTAVSQAQLIVTGETTPNPSFVNQVISNLVGHGVHIVPGSISYTGDPRQLGIFRFNSSTTGTIPFQRGIILSTGDVSKIPSTNQVSFLSTAFEPTGFADPGDPILDNYTSWGTMDAATLEFTIIPESNQLTLNYVVGTEEYPDQLESSGTTINDLFGFYVTGQNPVPFGSDYVDQPIAWLPNLQMAGIYTIFTQSDYTNPTPNDLYHNFNAISIPLTCTLDVQPCTEYTIRLKIADVGSEHFDSAVFFEANSIGRSDISVHVETALFDSTTYEGCAPAKLIFKKNDPAQINTAQTITLQISGTAIPGADYTAIPTQFTIPAGRMSDTLEISAAADGIPEPDETIIISYGAGCGFEDQIVIYIKPQPEVQVMPIHGNRCDGLGPATIMAEVTSGVPPYSYSWSPVSSTTWRVNVSPDVTSNYTCTVTDFCGNTGSTTVTVNVLSRPPRPVGVSNTPLCAGDTIKFDVETMPGATYRWSGPDGWQNNEQNPRRPNAFGIMAGTYILFAKVGECESPPTLITVQIVDPNVPAPLTSNAPICEGDTLKLSTPITGTEVGYHWTGPDNFTSDLRNPFIADFRETFAGDYTLFLTLGTCTTAVNTLNVPVNPSPVAEAGDDLLLCSGSPGTLGVPQTPDYTYSWSPATGLSSATASNPILQLTNTGTEPMEVKYYVTTDLNGCKRVDSVTALITPVPTISFQAPAAQCFGNNSFDFTAIGNFTPQATVTWDFGPFSEPQTVTGLSASDIHFNSTGIQPVSVVVDDNGCKSQPFTINVNVLEMPVANFDSDVLEGCSPTMVKFKNLSEPANVTRLWNFGDGTSSNASSPTVVYKFPKNYTVSLTVTNSLGCSDTYTINQMIRSYPTPEAGFALSSVRLDLTDPILYVDDESRFGGEISYEIIDPYGNVESITGSSFRHVFRDSGDYIIRQLIENEFGCSDDIERKVRVDLGFKVFIPTAFSPNGDEKNDRFTVQGEEISEFEMRIYNRWGQLVYHSYDYQNGWDGRVALSNEPVQGGVYLYIIDLKNKYGKDFHYTGTVNVLR